MNTTITPDTTIYTFTADFAGYTLLDSILGPMNPEKYGANNGDDNDLTGFCDWLSDLVFPMGGFWLSEDEAQEWLDEQERPIARTLESFTPRSIHDRIMAAGRGRR